MAQPPAYAPNTQFLSVEVQQAWFPGQELDTEFNNVATSISAIRANMALLQNDDGTLRNGVVGWDQLAPAFQLSLREQGFTGAPTSGPLTWVGLQTFTTGISSIRYATGGNNFPTSFVDIETTTGLAGYGPGSPAFVFNDLATSGWNFADASLHVALAIFGNKSVSAGVPNGLGSYTALQVTQNGQGAGASTYLTGALLQAVAVYNPLGQNSGNFTGANPQVQIPAAGGGVITVQSAVGAEIDLLLQQNVVLKQGLRVYDYYAGVGTTTQNSSAIRVLKAPAGGGWSTGLIFASDYSAGYLDSGFPIIAGGTMIAGFTTSLSLASALNLSGMLGGFSTAAIVLPVGTVANNGIIWGPSGLAGYIISATNTGGGGIEFANGFTFFQFGNANACWFTTGTTDGRIGFLGTGGGTTTLATANAGASVFTLTLPAITDTIVTLTASQTLSNKTFTGTLTMPDGSTWTSSGLADVQPITITLNGLGVFGPIVAPVSPPAGSDALIMKNTTAAAAGAQQNAPNLHFVGQGWNPTAAASQTVDWLISLQPVQGVGGINSGQPTAGIFQAMQTNGGGYNYVFYSQLIGNQLNTVYLGGNSGNNAGAAFAIQNNFANIMEFGNYSAVFGNAGSPIAYDARGVVYSANDMMLITGASLVPGLTIGGTSHGLFTGAATGGDKGAGTLNLAAALFSNGTQVVSSRVTGWNAVTTGGGAVSRGTFDTGATLLTTAETLAALITDLRAHGLIGT